jgi:hypothetical protein
MPTPTYTPLATVTLGTTAASVTFSSIPATYRDLILVYNGTVNVGTDARVRLNGDSGSNYSWVAMFGNGSTTGSPSSGSATGMTLGYPGTGLTNIICQIMDYSATDKHKTALSRSSNAAVVVSAHAGRWANTAAVTSLGIESIDVTFQSGSTFNLYGVIA